MSESFEQIKSPELVPSARVRLMFTRHAERLPSGILSPEGVEHARANGKRIKESGAKIFKAYVSDHKSGRAFDTGDMMAQASEITSEFSGKQYRTHKVRDIQYDILKPDLSDLIVKAKDIIDEATLKELGMSTERNENRKLKIDLEQLSIDEQERIAPIRQKCQRIGIEYVLKNEAAVNRMAMGLAHQLVHEIALTKEYIAMRNRAKKPMKGDMILNTVSHGMFLESLLRKVGVLVTSDGGRQEGIEDFEDPNFGGYIEPGESVTFVVGDSACPPKEIPVEFERDGRPEKGRVFIDTEKLSSLSKEYEEWTKNAV